jgi:nitrite reductase/ring-hydroxylating ferredoxin subunit
MKFVEAYSLHDLPPGTSRPVRIGTTDIALFNVEGTVYALENSCLHAGAALTGGPLCGKTIACRAHGWRYDVTTGALIVAPQMKVRTFPVQVADGKVMVQLEA